MMVRGTFLMVLIAFLGMVSSGYGQDDGVIEVLLIDGPGGYLPNVGDEADSNVDTSPMSSLSDDDSIGYPIMYGNLLDILSYWENYLGLFFA